MYDPADNFQAGRSSMTRLAEHLADLAGAVATAADAPDRYPEFLVEIFGGVQQAYEANKAQILEAWTSARPNLKRDLDKVHLIDQRLESAFAAFEGGDRELGRTFIFEVYNLQLRKLR
ncbi:hypothetical protein [Stenotrophomonas sp. PS02300]|uniref:hypothetical protein n=1 Tax=Stenotrophomonas sp. PS02300 TaxID=2991426 RepID=UPI00249AD00B|nr:hypothetical protein [Stenotrophomonas sp. PS02300]